MAETKRILSKLSLANIFQTYNITNKLAFTVNLVQYLVLIKNNSYKIDAGYKYRLYFYRYILGIQYNTSQTIWDRILYLMVRRAFNGLDYSDIAAFTSNVPTSTLHTLIDTIEYVLYKYQDTTLSNVQDFGTVFSITRDSNNLPYINGQPLINGNVRVTLYKLAASAIKTIVANSILYTNITNDSIYDPSVTNEDNSTQTLTQQLNDAIAQLTALASTVGNIDSRVTNLQNGLIANDSNDVTQLGAINQLQLSKVNTSVTINGHRLDTPAIVITKEDIGLGNVDNTSSSNIGVTPAMQTALDLKVDKATTINGFALNTSSVTLTPASIGLGNVENTSDANKPVSTAQLAALSQKVDKTTSINNQLLTGNITLTKFDVNLGNVDNTADLAKPVSTATQVELNLKVDKSISVNNKPLSANVVLSKDDIGLDQVDNTSDLAKPVSLAHQFELNLKADKSTTINSHPISSDVILNKSDIGLNNVDNTSDDQKPVSTPQQLALNLKVDLTRLINNHSLASDVVITKNDIGLSNVDNTSDIQKPVSIASQIKFDTLNNSMQVLSDLTNTKVDKFITVNGQSLTADVVITRDDIGDLDQVDNTSDIDKPLSSATIAALSLKEDKINKNIANGYAGLDSTGRLLLSVMPPVIGSSLLYLGTWNAQTNTPTITSGQGTNGNYYKVSVNGTTNIDGVSVWQVGDWIIYNGTAWQRIINTENVNSVNSQTGNVVLTKNDIGLANVDNTSDAQKPVSIDVQNALNLKLNKFNLPVANNLPIITATGQLADSNLKIDDNSNTLNNLWTSLQTYSMIRDASINNIPDYFFSNYSVNSSSLFGNSLTNYCNSFAQSEARLELYANVPVTTSAQPYAGSVYSPFENRVYFVPFNQTGLLHYVDCATGVLQSLPITGLVAGAYIGGAYSPSLNRIYFAPFNQTNTLHYVDCSSGTISTYSCNTLGVQYLGAVFSPRQNRIYFIANSSATTWLYIDCTGNGSVGSFTHAVSYSPQSFAGGVYSPVQNRIYLVPYAVSPNWYFIDCAANTLNSFVSNATILQGAYIGGVYVPDNNSIYFVPYMQRSNIHVFNCSTLTVSTYPYSGNYKCAGGVYVPGGRVYFIPAEINGNVICVNTRSSNSIQMLGSTVAGESYGATYVPSSNKVYLAPNNQNYWYTINVLDNSNFSRTLSSGALFNKL